jgi:hypothetical protein
MNPRVAAVSRQHAAHGEDIVVRFTFALILSSAVCLAAPNCTSGTLADYLGLPAEGCRLGPRVLSAFEALPVLSGATEIDPAAVQVMPTVAGATGSLLLTFSNGAAQNGAILESFFALTVEPDAATGENVTLALMNASASMDGVVTGIVELCDDAIFLGLCTGNSQALISLVSSFDSLPVSSGSLGQVPAFFLSHDITVDAGLNGAASIGAAQLTFTTVPEPGTAAGCLAALALAAALRCRKFIH